MGALEYLNKNKKATQEREADFESEGSVIDYAKTNRGKGISNTETQQLGIQQVGESFVDPGVLNLDTFDEDVPIASLPNIQDIRGERQSGINQLGRGLLSRGLSVIPKIGAGFGYVVGAIGALGNEIINPEKDNFAMVYDNVIADMFEGIDEELREQLPIYKTVKSREGNLLEQMGTAGFWADDVFDGVAYAASAFAPAAGIGALGKTLKVAGSSSKFLQASPLYATTAYNAISEAGAEANDTNKSLRSKLIGKINPATEKPFTIEEIRQVAGEKAAETFAANAALLVIPNYIQSKFFLGNPVKNAGKLKRSVLRGEVGIDDIDVWKQARKDALKGVISEGVFEEGLQTAVQGYGERSALGETDKNFVSGVANEWLNGWTTTEGQKAMMLGALIGGPMGFVSGAKQARSEQENIKAIKENWEKNVIPYLDQIDKQYIENIESIYDENGNLDVRAANRLFYQAINDKQLFDEATVAAINNDENHAVYNNKMATSRKLYQYLTNNAFENSDEALEAMNRDVQDATKEDEEADSTNAQQDMGELKEIYNRIDDQISSIDDVRKSEDEIDFQEVLKKALFFEAVKRSALEDISSSLPESQNEQLETLINDSQTRTDHLLNKTERNKLFDQYKDEIDSFSAVLDKKEKLTELRKKGEANSLEATSLAYDIYEQEELEGQFVTANTFKGTFDERLRTGKLSRKDQHRFNIGMDASVTETLNTKIEEYKNGDTSLNEVIRTITDPEKGKYFINNDDLAKVQELIDLKEKDVLKAQQEAEAASIRLSENPPTIVEFDPEAGPFESPNPEFDEQAAAADQAVIDNAITESNDLLDANDSAQMLRQLSDQGQTNKDLLEGTNVDNVLRRRIADDYVFDDIASIRSAFDNNPDVYDRVEEVDAQIEKVTNLREIFKTTRADLIETAEFDGFMQSLDDIIEYLKTVEEAAINNRSNRAIADKKYQERVTASKFNSFGLDTETGTITDSNVYNVISALIGNEVFEKIIDEAKANGFNDAYAEKIILELSKKNKKELKGLQSLLDEKYELAYANLVKEIESTLEGKAEAQSIQQLLGIYKSNPSKMLEELLNQASGAKTDDQRHAIDKYNLDKDILNFINNANSETTTGRSKLNKDLLLSVLKDHQTLQSVQDLKGRLASDFDIKSEIVNEKEYQSELEKNNSAIVPTNQQLTSIRAAMNWFTTKLPGKQTFDTWAYQKGLAGSGKTTVVAKWFIKLAGLTADEVYVTANNESATKTINDALGYPAKKTVHELIALDLNDTHKLLVIDEIGAVPLDKLIQLSKLVNDINADRATRKVEPLKILVLGDPTQINAEGVSSPPINFRISGLNRIQEMPPLTIRYRSNVSAVVDLQDTFLDNDREVLDLVVKADRPVGEIAIGAHIAFSEATIREQIALNSGRTKAIIVFDEAAKDRYAGVENAEIITYVESQGRTFGEVFVDISQKDIKNISNYNKAVYTATSRASDYVMLLDHTSEFQNRTLATVVTNKEQQEEQINDNLNKYKDRLSTEEAILFDKGEKRPKTTVNENVTVKPEDVEEPTEETADTAEDNQGNNAEVKGKVFIDTKLKGKDSNNIHELDYPTQSPINYHTKSEFKENLIKKGDKVLYLRSEDEKGNLVVRIVAEKPLNPGHYVEIGILGETEDKSILGTSFAEISKIDVANKLNKNGTLLLTDGPSILLEGVVEEAVPLTYIYDNTNAYFEGSGLIDRLSTKFQEGFLKMKNKFNGVTILKREIIIPSQQDVEDLNKQWNISIKPGIPYMMMYPSSSKGKAISPQYIRLNPRKLDKNKDSELLQPLNDFYNAITTLEGLGIGNLGDVQFNKIIKEFKKDFELNADKQVVRKSQNATTVGTFTNATTAEGEQIYTPEAIAAITANFDQISKAVEPVIKGFYGYGTEKVNVTAEEFAAKFADETLYKKADPDKYGNAYFELSNDILYTFKEKKDKKGNPLKTGLISEMIVDQETGATTPVVTEGGYLKGFSQKEVLKAGKGKAQNALNVIAIANAAVQGVGIRVRSNIRGNQITSAKSILAERVSDSGYAVYLKKIIAPTLAKGEKVAFIETDEDIANAENYITDNALTTPEELQIARNQFVVEKISSNTIKNIVDPDTDATYYLRTPLSRPEINKLGENIEKNKNELESKLSSSLSDVIGTRIQVRVGQTKPTPDTTEKTTTDDTRKKQSDKRAALLEKRKKGRGRRLVKVKNTLLGQRVTTKEAQSLIRQLIPGIQKEDMRFISRATMTTLTDEESWGVFKDGVIYIQKNEDGTLYENVLRHEVFHKIFSEYLTEADQLELIRAFRKEVSSVEGESLVEFEEMIAEKFQDWNNKKFAPRRNVIIKFFQWLSKRFGFINKNTDNLDKFFRSINEGYFDKQVRQSLNIERNLLKVKEWFGSTDNFRIIKNELVLDKFIAYREIGDDNGYPMTKNEIRKQVLQDIKDELNELQNDLKEETEEELIESIREEIFRAERAIENFDKVIEFVYPNWTIKEGDFIEETMTDDQLLDAFEKEDLNLNEYTIESDSVNHEGKLSDNVKDFLADIQTPQGDWVDPRFAYVKLLQTLEGIQTDSSNFIKQIHERLINEGNNPKSQVIINRLLELIDSAEATRFDENGPEGLVGKTIPNNYKFLDENTFIFSEKDVSGINTISEAKNLRISIFNRADIKRAASTKLFVDSIIKLIEPTTEIQTEAYDQLVGTLRVLYDQYTDRNTLREMLTNFNSQKEKNIRFSQIRTEYGRKTMSYITGKVYDSNNAIKNKVTLALTQKLSDPRKIKTFKTRVYNDLVTKYKNDNVEFVKKFAIALGLKQYTAVLPEEGMLALTNDIIALFETNRLGRVGEIINESDSDADISEIEEGNATFSIEAILEGEANSMINNFTKVLSFGNDFVRATSIKDSKGKKKYVWNPSNQAAETIINLARQAKTKLFDGQGSFKNLDLPAFMKNEYFQNNIFTKGINSIYNIIDHDGIREENVNTGDTIITDYTKEKFKDYVERHFGAAFLAGIGNSRKNLLKYTQFFYTISNKPNAVGAEIRALNATEIKDAIKQTFIQFALKENQQVENGDRTRIINFNLMWEAANDVIGDSNIVYVDSKGVQHIDITSREAHELADRIVNKMEEKLLELSKKVTDRIISEELDFDQNLNRIEKLNDLVDDKMFPGWNVKDLVLDRTIDKNGDLKIGTKRNKVFKIRESWKDASARVGRDLTVFENRKGAKREYLVNKDELLPLTYAFISNDYVNSYSLNQLVAGDSGFFKNGLDQVKRLSGTFAPGLRGFVHPTLGMKKSFRLAVGKDLFESTDESTIPFLKRMGLTDAEVEDLRESFGEGYEFTDAQGFITPERFDDIKNGFGEGYGLSNVIKPAHYEIDADGIPRMIKYSAVVLTDELANKHPKVAKLRENMRRNKVDEYVFRSANKAGIPSILVDSAKMLEEDVDMDNISTMELSNVNYRLQLNPYHSVDSNVANPTQLGYFLKILETNVEDATRVYSTLGQLISTGLDNFKTKSESDGVFNGSKFKNLLLKKLEGAGNERVHEFLTSLGNAGKFKMPWNFPTIVDKAVIQLGSLISKDTVKIKFSGGKLVLQSSYAIEQEVTKEPLKYVNREDGIYYAEVILPKGMVSQEQEQEIQDAIENGTTIPDVFLYNDLLGFRIPSSELHSAVPLKVVGFYDTAGTNVVIAPKEIVPLHGSDYDVDALFIIRREYDRVNGKLTGEPIGYKNGKFNFNLNTEGFTPQRIEMYNKNIIVETFLKVIGDPKNRKRMMSPISMEALHNDVARIAALKGERGTKSVDLSNILDRQVTHSSSFEGAAGTGIFANGIKVLAYMVNSSSTNSNPTLMPQLTEAGEVIPSKLIIDGTKYNKLSDESGLWETLDSLLNAAIDNVKEQILPALNLTGNTIKHYVALRGLGMSDRIVNDIMVQPIISKYITYKVSGLRNTKGFLESLLGENANTNDITITTEELEKHISDNRNINDLVGKTLTDTDIEFLNFQAAVLELFEEAERVGSDLTDMSKYLNIIGDMPVTKDAVDDLIDIRNNIWTVTKEGMPVTNTFSFDVDNFFTSNPHISAANDVLNHLDTMLEARFFKHNRNVYGFVADVFKDFKVKLDDKLNKDKEMKRNEFIRYILSGIQWDNNFKGYENVEPFAYKDYKGNERTLTDRQAFNAHMATKIQELQKYAGLEDNLFLNNLSLRYNDFVKQYVIEFTAGNNLDYLDIVDITDAFNELANYKLVPQLNEDGIVDGWQVEPHDLNEVDDQGYSDIQKDFVRYGVLNYGLNFGTSNYSLVLPPNIYKSLYRNLESSLMSLVNNTDRLDKLVDHFGLEVAINYTDNITYFKNEPVNSGTEADAIYQGHENGVYFDRKFAQFKNENGEATIKFPKLIYKQAFKKYTAYYKVHETDDNAYYQRIGNKNSKVVYTSNSDIIRDGYNIDEAFRPDILNIQVADINQPVVEFESRLIKEGMTISLTNFNDTSRLNKRYANVVSKNGKILTLETVEVAPVVKEELTTEERTKTNTEVIKISLPSDEDTLDDINHCLN